MFVNKKFSTYEEILFFEYLYFLLCLLLFCLMLDMKTKIPYRIMPIYIFLPRRKNIRNRLPCSAVSHVTPSVDNFHKFAIPAIRVMQPPYGAAHLYFIYILTLFFFTHCEQ